MDMFMVNAIAAPINALLCCAMITFFLKGFKLKPAKRMVFTYVIYMLLSFVGCAGGNGIFNIDMANFDTTRFLLYIVSGFCVCLGIYLFYIRGEISEKIAAKKAKK